MNHNNTMFVCGVHFDRHGHSRMFIGGGETAEKAMQDVCWKMIRQFNVRMTLEEVGDTIYEESDVIDVVMRVCGQNNVGFVHFEMDKF